MSVRTVQLSDFAKELGRWSEEHIKQNRDAVAAGVIKSVPDLVRASPVDTGLYAQSWDTEVLPESVTIGNYAPHAAIIEDGARPHYPPIKPLLQWAKRKLRSSSQAEGNYSPEVWALAKAVQHKIGTQGQAPKKILTNAMPQIYDNVRAELVKREQGG